MSALNDTTNTKSLDESELEAPDAGARMLVMAGAAVLVSLMLYCAIAFVIIRMI